MWKTPSRRALGDRTQSHSFCTPKVISLFPVSTGMPRPATISIPASPR